MHVGPRALGAQGHAQLGTFVAGQHGHRGFARLTQLAQGIAGKHLEADFLLGHAAWFETAPGLALLASIRDPD